MENKTWIKNYAKNNTSITKNTEWNEMYPTYLAKTRCYVTNSKTMRNILTHGITWTNAIISPDECLICENRSECASWISDAMKDYIFKIIQN